MRVNVTETMLRKVIGMGPALLWRYHYLNAHVGTLDDLRSLATLVILEKGVKLGLSSRSQHWRWSAYLAKYMKSAIKREARYVHSVPTLKGTMSVEGYLDRLPARPSNDANPFECIRNQSDRELVEGYYYGELKGDRNAQERARQKVKRHSAIIRSTCRVH